uniref:protein-histidine N-methyltransferase n=1 Tax=Parasteatoda tepidariorum TaxID=114398 RepID=A0A2L2YQP2_PARTP
MAFRFNFNSPEKLSDFRFNFNSPEKLSDSPSELKPLPELNENKKLSHGDCKYISADDLTCKVDQKITKKIQSGNLEIKFVTEELISTVPSYLNNSESDLLPDQYEEGFIVWECSVDLLRFLSSENCIHPDYSVLELGCGVGLPGLFSYLCGAHVTFQDFNSEVLELITAPNVFLNSETEDSKMISNRCKFLSGDWGDIEERFFPDRKTNELFDVILTSETIYNRESQKKLLKLMKSVLKQNGIIYVAAKSHYFGVGGGIANFEDLLKEDNTFDFSTVLNIQEGLDRQILKLTFKDKR